MAAERSGSAWVMYSINTCVSRQRRAYWPPLADERVAELLRLGVLLRGVAALLLLLWLLPVAVVKESESERCAAVACCPALLPGVALRWCS